MADKHFQFADFVDEFRVVLTIFDKRPGHYNDVGKWVVEGDEVPRDIWGIVLPASSNSSNSDEIRFVNDGGKIERKRKIYTTEQLTIGQEVEHSGQRFTIDSENSYSAYADVFIYHAAGVDY